MPLPLNYATSRGGPPPGGSSYFAGGEFFSTRDYGLTATDTISVNGTSEQTIWTVPGVPNWAFDGSVTDSGNPGNAVAAGPIAAITAIRLATNTVALAANVANLTISMFLYRGGSVVGTGAFAGWATASNAAIGIFSSGAVPFLVSNTALIDPTTGGAATVASRAILPVQPNDVVTLRIATAGAVNVPRLVGYLDLV